MPGGRMSPSYRSCFENAADDAPLRPLFPRFAGLQRAAVPDGFDFGPVDAEIPEHPVVEAVEFANGAPVRAPSRVDNEPTSAAVAVRFERARASSRPISAAFASPTASGQARHRMRGSGHPLRPSDLVPTPLPCRRLQVPAAKRLLQLFKVRHGSLHRMPFLRSFTPSHKSRKMNNNDVIILE